jgi:hypothetical protein
VAAETAAAAAPQQQQRQQPLQGLSEPTQKQLDFIASLAIQLGLDVQQQLLCCSSKAHASNVIDSLLRRLRAQGKPAGS